jgi:GT2 family glycosyltransferase
VDVLQKTLAGLASQTFCSEDYEVLIIDDGSTDQTPAKIAQHQPSFPVPLYYYYQPNRKQGAARNLGARNASGEFLVFLGDDTVPRPNFLEEHQRSHSEHHTDDPANSKIAVIGYTTWPPDSPRSRFLNYIGEHGWQFGFSLITDPVDLAFNYFYTSNLSIGRKFFLDAGGFDEGFREYGWEDTELSLRLKKLGMRIVFNREAVTYHHHPITIQSFADRQRRVGHSAWTFLGRHPEMGSFLGLHPLPRYSWLDHVRMRVLTWLCRYSEFRDWPDLSRYYPDLMTYYYLRGAIEARFRESGENSPNVSG